jgi:protein involved in polysaccharide export with SLBB domain
MLEEINWDYAVIERLDEMTLAPKLIPFNLGKLVLEQDPAADVTLEAGDSVVIFNKQDVTVPISRQTRYVVLAGEFKQAGVHQAKAGETLRQLVKRVGGFTTEAYPYGAEFTRKSARIDQQRKLDAMLDVMERDLERSASTRLQSAADPGAVAAQEADIRAARARIEKLRQLKASGRIPLELRPDATVEQLPDVLLEDGDKLIIPSKPTVLSVFGSVYNENSFLYKPGKSIADYLAQAGGPTRDADEGRSYVLRADGTVSTNTSTWFGLGSSYKLLPGDSIVVPERLNKTTWMKDLRDWTQIMYQFGIGVAALRTLSN